MQRMADAGERCRPGPSRPPARERRQGGAPRRSWRRRRWSCGDAGGAAAAAAALQLEPVRCDRADDRDRHRGQLPAVLHRPVLSRRAADDARRGGRATALCLLLGLPLAYRLARMPSRWKTPVHAGDGAAAVHRQHGADGGLDDPVRAWRAGRRRRALADRARAGADVHAPSRWSPASCRSTCRSWC